MRSRSHWQVLDTPRAKQIVRFLRRAPIPERLIATDEHGEEITVAVKVDGARPKWTDVTQAVLRCSLLVALGSNGDILRKLELDPDDPQLDLIDQQRQAKKDLTLPGREPIISVDVPALVRAIAEAMKDVAQTAATQQATAYQSGMASMVSVVNLCINMLQRVDERLEDRDEQAAQLEADRHALLAQGQDEKPSTRDMLLQAALAKALGGEGAGAGAGVDGNGAVDANKLAALTQLFHQFAQKQGGTPPEEGST